MGEERSNIMTCLQMCLRAPGFQPTLRRAKSRFLQVGPENHSLLSVLTVPRAQVSISCVCRPVKDIPDRAGIVPEPDEAEIS